MPELEIIGGPASNFVWTCRIACAEKRVPYKLVSVMPHTPEVDAIHPLGKIPAMRYGDVTLCESRAICAFIDRMFDGPPLVPADPIAAARVEQWLSIVNTAIDPVWVRQYVGAGYLFPGTPDKSPNRAAIEAALPKMEKQFPVMDHGRRQRLSRRCLVHARRHQLHSDPVLHAAVSGEQRAARRSRRTSRKYLERHLARKSVQETIPQSLPGTAGA